LAALAVLAFLFAGAPAEAAKHKKSSSSSSKKASHKPHKSAPASGKSAGSAPAEDAGEDDDSESAEDQPQQKKGNGDEADAPPFKAKKVAKAKDDDDDDSNGSESSGSGDDDSGDGTVIHHKARKTAAGEGAEGAPLGLQIAVGPRAVHRTWDFHDPLSDFRQDVPAPAAYNLPAGPAPFVDLAVYPAAFAGGGILSNFGLIGRYEKLIGTSSVANKGTPQETTSTTSGQQFELGVRGRIPLGAAEVGITGSYGQHVFHVASRDLGPSMGSVLPNVDYTFGAIGADTRIRAGVINIGAHVGTRLMLNTGALQKYWFHTVTTTSIDTGLSLGYPLTPNFEIVGGADLIRYGFAFDPKTNQGVVAGGAVDQYISGYLALRVSISGG
jgi:hypothetical protein